MLKMLRGGSRQTAIFMLIWFTGLMLMNGVQAAMVETQWVLSEQQTNLDRESLGELVQADELRQQLMALGVDADVAAERIARLSDEELRELNGKLQELPAGSGVLGTAVFVFLVLLATDILGYTDVFPFVK